MGSELTIFLFEGLQPAVLLLAVAGTGGVHAFFYSPLGDELLLEALQVGCEHLIGYTAQGYGHIAKLFGREGFDQRTVGVVAVVGSAESEHLVEAGMIFVPQLQ